MTNKRGSVVLILLVASFLIVFSGIIITYEIEKSKGNNFEEKNVILLDKGENINLMPSLNLLSSEDESGISNLVKKSSEKKLSSKKKSSSKKSLSKDENIENNLESLSSNLENQNLTNNITLPDKVFEKNGTKYIMRDGEEYRAVSSGGEIQFSPPLPLSVCVGEVIDIGLDLGTVDLHLSSGDYLSCVWNDYQKDISVKYCLMEADTFSEDDKIKCGFGTATTYDCETLNLENYHGIEVKRIFSNVKLSDQFGGAEDTGTIEVYAKVSNLENDFYAISTQDYNIDKDSNCQCFSGACCNIATHRYKPSGSQPTGYVDSYYCSGTNSPIGTNYVMRNNYYCNGNDANWHSSTSTKDTCGTCEYCTSGDSTCNYYSNSQTCGTKDCDYRDTNCRDYHDVNKYCNGAGSCGSGRSCNDYTNEPKGFSCGTNKECDGQGVCVTCTSHSSVKCSGNDVYWYDSCGNKEGKRYECGDNSCGSWLRDTCHGDNAYETKTCYNKGCTSSGGAHCYSNQYEDERFIEICQYGCINGNCKSNPNIECSTDRECGTDGYVDSPWCSNNDVHQWFRIYDCINPGTASSYCSFVDSNHLVESCEEDEYSSNYCYDNDVYRDFTEKGCSDGVCFEKDLVKQKIKECGVNGCANGNCVASVPKPDLTVTELEVQNINGKIVVLAFTIKNIGDAIGKNIYWMIDSDSTDANPKRTSAINLGSGDWTRAYMKMIYSKSGSYNPKVIVDFDNILVESNEDNNEKSILINV